MSGAATAWGLYNPTAFGAKDDEWSGLVSQNISSHAHQTITLVGQLPQSASERIRPGRAIVADAIIPFADGITRGIAPISHSVFDVLTPAVDSVLGVIGPAAEVVLGGVTPIADALFETVGGAVVAVSGMRGLIWSHAGVARRTSALAAYRIGESEPIVWASSVSTPAFDTSAFNLVLFAERRLSAGESAGRASLTADGKASLRKVMKLLVRDNGPTPQLGPTGTGGVEIQWLSGGVFISALFEPEGDYSLYALRDDTDVLMDLDLDAGELPSVEDRARLRDLLAEMGKAATSRPAYWL
jgi:hypothetical protein